MATPFSGRITFVARSPPSFLIVDDNVYVPRALTSGAWQRWRRGRTVHGTKVESGNGRNPWRAVTIATGLGAVASVDLSYEASHVGVGTSNVSGGRGSGNGRGRGGGKGRGRGGRSGRARGIGEAGLADVHDGSGGAVPAINAGIRQRGNKHGVGHEAVVLSAQVPALQEQGNPLWRGMYRVRGRAGDAAASGKPEVPRLQNAVLNYTDEGKNSTYKYINKKLKEMRGARGIPKKSLLYMHVVDLTMAVRLLWSPSGPNLVYRGVDAANFNTAEYEQAHASGLHVFWYSFSSTSTDRQVALQFATGTGGNPGALFTIRRSPAHAVAADLSRCSRFPEEHEVLLLPEQAFCVLSVCHGENGAPTEVELEEVPRFPADAAL